MKKLRDISEDPQNEKIDLRPTGSTSDIPRLEKEKHNLKKHISPITEVKDLSGGKKKHYIYIKGERHRAPKYLGNLLRIGVGGFFIILILTTLGAYSSGKKIEKELRAQAHEGLSYLVDAGKSATKIQFDQALDTFEKALSYFNSAKDQLWFFSSDQTFYGKNQSAGQAVTALVEGGKNFSAAGNYFIEAMEEFNKIPLYFVTKNSDPDAPQPSITDTLKTGLEKTDLAIEQITKASEYILKIREDRLPISIAARVTFAKAKIAEISELLQTISTHFPALLKLLGDRYPHRYLILLQNNNEIRPSGGFIGSYAIVDMNEGYISNIDVQDVYKLDNAYGAFIRPPDELLNFTDNWRLRDSNYSPDFAISAAKARWFMQKEGGPTVDTVIAINQGLLQDMLEITGPVQVGNFGKLNASNYNLLLTYIIEGKVWGDQDPKHILKIFIPAFKDAILKKELLSRTGSKLYRAIQQKHIMFYSPDQEIQALFDALNVSGRTHEVAEKEDYLSVINMSMGGTKSDGYIEEKITHDTFIAANGTLTDEVTIRRTHQWTEDIYNEWLRTLNAYGFNDIPDRVADVLGRGRNKSGIRVYVPQGSVLLESNDPALESKFDLDLNKAYFFTTVEIRPGESKEIKIKYSLPYKLNFPDSYKLIVEKQPGSRGSIFNKTLSTDSSLHNIALYPSDARIDQSGNILYPTNLVYDKYFSGIWGK